MFTAVLPWYVLLMLCVGALSIALVSAFIISRTVHKGGGGGTVSGDSNTRLILIMASMLFVVSVSLAIQVHEVDERERFTKMS
jgi:hypothetical protein